MGRKKRRKRLLAVAEDINQAASGHSQQVVDDLVEPIRQLCEAESTPRYSKCAELVEHMGHTLVDLLPCNISDETILIRLTLLQDVLREVNAAHRSKFFKSRWTLDFTCRLPIDHLTRRLADIDSSFLSLGKLDASRKAFAKRRRRLLESSRFACQGIGAVLQALPMASVFSPIPKGFGAVIASQEKRDQNTEAANQLERRLDRIETNGGMNTRSTECMRHCRDLLHKHQSRRNVTRLAFASLDVQDFKAECDLDRSLLDDIWRAMSTRSSDVPGQRQTFQNGVIFGSVSMVFLSMTGARSVCLALDAIESNMDLPSSTHSSA
ncbi:hypothetical protein BDZ89DRAFT_1129970 [Hymenopellis radicata]|nr:hypothetical protein BDZ89DRAFT_1129970 [Hymenopellis radicata]